MPSSISTVVCSSLPTRSSHTCALFESGSVRCWGAALQGQLGYGNTNPIGDDEPPVDAAFVPVGGRVVQVSAGGDFTCALLESGTVRCWGEASALGLGSSENIGDNESPESVDPVPIL